MFNILLFRGYFSFFNISIVVTLNLILLFELKILFEIGNISRGYVGVYQF